MKRACSTMVFLLVVLNTGCVFRRMTVMSDPPGARLFVNNVEVGTTPCNVPTNAFIDLGNYKFTLFKDGFEPLEVLQPVPPKWYEYPGVDVFSELGPWMVRDLRVFNYQMQPVREKSGDELKQQADEFRQRGGGGASTSPVIPGPGTVVPGSPPPGIAPAAGVSPPPGVATPPRSASPTIPVPPQ